MRRFAIFIFILSFYSECNSQKKLEYKPFSLLIIHPDSIQLHQSLRPFIDTVESDFREFYYSSIREKELFIVLKSEEEQHEERLRIQRAKWLEMDIHNTKYHHLVSLFTFAELASFFNSDQNGDFSFSTILKDELFSYDLERIAAYYEVDYVLSYVQITTPIENDEPVLKIEASLYSKKDGEVVHTSIAYGYSRFYKDNSGVLQACYNDLQCLLESAVIASSADLIRVLKMKQKK